MSKYILKLQAVNISAGTISFKSKHVHTLTRNLRIYIKTVILGNNTVKSCRMS